ncbi:Hypothetical protein FKW44_011887 [Caligus rogercresseyi]|uniref:Uncharacterized protein n=1 Tax=Caligus rogercresseyi TaxID=217165 RepID=A0A7T8HIL5_CALRO|nr:Hypothetical protein FKW44_025155 [Caligus rogercresseyi]QQP42255.1 Hypothetical protein FKW44_016864 [Caligus rogercresseyi]QQP50764.1 Hypothetical protein FKW44_011887 [Caligus rogercresseyi]
MDPGVALVPFGLKQNFLRFSFYYGNGRSRGVIGANPVVKTGISFIIIFRLRCSITLNGTFFWLNFRKNRPISDIIRF